MYLADVVTFLAVLYGVRRLRPMPPEGGGSTLGLGGGPATVGVLYAAIGAGGLVAAVFSGPLGHIRQQGRAMLIAVAVWGAAIGSVGLTHWLWLALGLLMLAGAADIVTTVFRATILQVNTPDELRGRLNGLDFVIGLGGPRLGDLRAGSVAGLADPVTSIIAGGAACVLGILALATASPTFRRYNAKATPTLTPEPRTPERDRGQQIP